MQLIISDGDERACRIESAVDTIAIVVFDDSLDVHPMCPVVTARLIYEVAVCVTQDGAARNDPVRVRMSCDVGLYTRTRNEGALPEWHAGADIDELALRIDRRADHRDAAAHMRCL